MRLWRGGCLTGRPQCRVSNSRNGHVACPLAKMLSYFEIDMELQNTVY